MGVFLLSTLRPSLLFDTIGGTMMRYVMTEEEKTAHKIASIVSDLRLDLDKVGVYLARISPMVSYNRLIVIAESAQDERDSYDRGKHQYRLF
jgi:hypothetical protein